MIVDLTQMQPGETGIVKEIQGGQGFIRKLQSMGVRQGKKIIKVSNLKSYIGHASFLQYF